LKQIVDLSSPGNVHSKEISIKGSNRNLVINYPGVKD